MHVKEMGHGMPWSGADVPAHFLFWLQRGACPSTLWVQKIPFASRLRSNYCPAFQLAFGDGLFRLLGVLHLEASDNWLGWCLGWNLVSAGICRDLLHSRAAYVACLHLCFTYIFVNQANIFPPNVISIQSSLFYRKKKYPWNFSLPGVERNKE